MPDETQPAAQPAAQPVAETGDYSEITDAAFAAHESAEGAQTTEKAEPGTAEQPEASAEEPIKITKAQLEHIQSLEALREMVAGDPSVVAYLQAKAAGREARLEAKAEAVADTKQDLAEAKAEGASNAELVALRKRLDKQEEELTRMKTAALQKSIDEEISLYEKTLPEDFDPDLKRVLKALAISEATDGNPATRKTVYNKYANKWMNWKKGTTAAQNEAALKRAKVASPVNGSTAGVRTAKKMADMDYDEIGDGVLDEILNKRG